MSTELLLCLILVIQVAAVPHIRFLSDDIKRHCQNCYDCECNSNDHLDCRIWGSHSCDICHTECPDKEVTTVSHQRTHTANCNKIGVLDVIARTVHASHPSSGHCGSDVSLKIQPEALVLSFCKAGIPSGWKPGKQILAEGAESCNVDNDHYHPVIYIDQGHPKYSAILIGCNKDEIKVVYQTCDVSPRVLHVDKNNKDINMHKFYVLRWT